MPSLKAVLITGASSGLGEALALAYAAPGVMLFLAARNAKRLMAVAKQASELGANVQTQALDVTDGETLAAWIKACDKVIPLDLVIANAGISAGTHKQGGAAPDDRAVFKTNIDGVLNTILPILPAMKERRCGQIALMASMASFRGMAGAAAYGASKAAVRLYGEALRGEMKLYGVKVNVICPGFVETPMTAINTCPMPFLIKADKAAAFIKRGLEANKARIAFPAPMAFLVWLFAAAPTALIDLLPIGYGKATESDGLDCSVGRSFWRKCFSRNKVASD